MIPALVAIAFPVAAQGQRVPPPEIIIGLREAELVLRSSENGFPQPLLDLLHEDAIVLWPGSRPLHGRGEVAVALMTLDAMHREMALAPRAERRLLSADSSRAFEWGVLEFRGDSAGLAPTGLPRFMAVWRRDSIDWALEVFAALNLPPSLVVPGGSGSNGRQDPPAPLGESPYAAVSEAFAKRVAEVGMAGALQEMAGPDAVTFRLDGMLNVGPEEISTTAARAGAGSWSWLPTSWGGAASGDLGWSLFDVDLERTTSGTSIVRAKYLAIWRRSGDGALRIWAMGGNGRE